MPTIKLLNHSFNTAYQQPHFFIQAKGYHAGRPSANPYANSYVILANDEIEKGMLFWVCFGLWKTNKFLPLLKSPYTLDQNGAAKLIGDTCMDISEHAGEFLSGVKELKDLIQTENLLEIQIKIIRKLKKSVSRKMLP